MINARRAILAIPILLAACSSAAPPTAGGPTPAAASTSVTATSTPAASTPIGATDAPTSSPAPSAALTATPGASLSGDLESLMPTEIAGNQMTIEPASDPANSFMILWNDEAIAQTLLTALAASSDDIDVVFSYPAGNTAPNQVRVTAYRVAGADAIALRDGFVENYRAYLAEHATVSVTDETVAGKQVVLLSLADTPPGQDQYFYGVGDIVFVIDGTPFEWVEDAIAQLP